MPNAHIWSLSGSHRCCLLQVQGCLPAMGYSFAAGTTDGPGTFTFRQGMKTENPLWNVVRNFLWGGGGGDRDVCYDCSNVYVVLFWSLAPCRIISSDVSDLSAC